jgi:hypothetical protein
MSQIKHNERIETLSELLVECVDYEDDFWVFATEEENEQAVRIALYAKNVTDGHAVATEKLISASEAAIQVLQRFLDQADDGNE